MKVKKNICYAQKSHLRSYLDIYLPDSPIHGVFIYFHGGGIEFGEKSFHCTQSFLDNGVAVVCPNYRLYPNAKYPEFIEDAAEAAAWVKQNPQEFDNCPNIFIGGSSAGGYLSMMLYFDGTYLGKFGLSCKDFSGFVFDAGQPTTHFNILRERGIETTRVIIDEAAPLYHIKQYDGEPEMLIFVAEQDIPNRYEQTILLRSTLKQFGYPDDIITYQYMAGCTHCSYLHSDEYAQKILRFIHRIWLQTSESPSTGLVQNHWGYYQYVLSNDTRLFTAVLLPKHAGKFPAMIIRTPYVDAYENEQEDSIVVKYLTEYNIWLKNGYAIVLQHCRGRGKSDGDCIPYIYEREDGLALQAWIRNQSFYNEELYLYGLSYLSSVHYATAPFATDIKGAIFQVQDSERYNICYRNGFKKVGLNGAWYVSMYKAKSHMKKNFTKQTFLTLPLSDFSETVFGEPAPDFDEILKHPNRTDAFWNTRYGGNDARNAIQHANIPILLTTAFYDLYTGGIFEMWRQLDEKTRSQSALLVSPYDHGDRAQQIVFPDGNRKEHFGTNYCVEWLNYIRKLQPESPVPIGKITYYRLFENRWKTDNFESATQKKLTFGEETHRYVYNPYDPASFKGGLCCNFGGAAFQDPPNSRHDIISVYSDPFAEETLVKGKMAAKLRVQSDCEDTCFYVRLSIEKKSGDWGLRDDITSLCYQHPDYVPDSEVILNFTFDEHAFLVQKGERIRMDISSSDAMHYVRHTNQKGLYSQQTTAKIAHNTVFLKDSYLVLPVE